jgi:hypothetical protein
MSSVSEETGDLVRRFSALPRKEQAAFMALVNDTKVKRAPSPPKSDEPHTAPSSTPRRLYAALAAKVFSIKGIRLPEYHYLGKTPAEAELQAVWGWLTEGAPALNQKTTNGLIDLVADAAAREIPWRKEAIRFNKPEEVARWLRLIPAAVDRAFPGYKHNGILLQVAAACGKGELPINTKEQDT